MRYDPDEMSAADYALDMDPDGFIKNKENSDPMDFWGTWEWDGDE
jgi:hypothetical protein